MDLHLFHFGPRQFAGLVQNVVRHGKLADVVKKCSGLKGVDLAAAKSEQSPEADRIESVFA